MTEYVQALQEIQQLPQDVHLFCPRSKDNEDDRFDEDETDVSDVQDAVRKEQIQAARVRRKKFMSATILLAFDGDDVVPYHDTIYDLLDRNLKRCEICVRRYHIERGDFLVQLRQDYNEPEIQDFLAILNRRDIARITEGLANIARTLRSLPENKRSVSAVEPSDLFSLFEALHCKRFHEDEDQLKEHFDEPFRLIQTKKPLKLNEILPAVTKFLFDSNTNRVSWAVETWDRVNRPPSELEWNYAVRDILQQKIQTCSNPGSSKKLWTAMSVILRSMDAKGIAYRLFDLSPPFYRLALDHLVQKTLSVPAIVLSLQEVLIKAPDVFWQSTQSIPLQQIVETIFSSPNYDQCLEASVQENAAKDSDVLSWTSSYLKSLPPVSRPTVCDPLVHQLFQRTKSDRLSKPARVACFKTAVKAIHSTICSFSEDEDARKAASRHAVADAFRILSVHLRDILDPPVDVAQDEVRNDVMGIIRNALALDCYCLKADFDCLTAMKPMGHDKTSTTAQVWSTVVDNLHDGNIHMSRAALIGCLPFTGLDEVRVREPRIADLATDVRNQLQKNIKAYNQAYTMVTEKLGEITTKIAEFTPEHLDILFKEQQTSMTLFATLFSGDESVYQSSMGIIKNISGASGRKEALDHVLQAFFTTSLYSIDWVFRRFANVKAFAPVPRLLSVGKDVRELLCDPTGFLSTQKMDPKNYTTIHSYWSYQWSELRIIFQNTEQWSYEVHNKELMMNVARNTMQYARDLFDKYHLFLKVLQELAPEKVKDMAKILLDTDPASASGSPAKCFYGMSQWLRLRDQYLADTLTTLITSMLRRLKDYGAEMQSTNFDYLLAVLIPGFAPRNGKSGAIRTILNAQQKAELTRAVEYYLGKAIIEHPSVKRQSTLNKWTLPGDSSGTSTPKSITVDIDEDEFDDADIQDHDLREASRRHEATQRVQHDKASDSASMKAVSTGRTKALPLIPVAKSSSTLARELREKAARDRQAANGKAFIEQRNRERAAAEARRKEASLKARGLLGVGEQTAGAGSGLSGIGVKGKDHAAALNSIMVSSSESEDDEDDDDELFGKVAVLQQRNSISGIRKPLSSGPTRKVKQVRSQKDIRARLTPDLSSLHKDILSWDFFADSETPPSSNKSDYTLVTNTFRTTQDYVRTFEPLLVLEAWQSFRSAREDGNFKTFELKVASSLIVDNFFEVNTVIPFTEQKEIGLGVSDIVLLSKGKQPTQDKDEPHCLARVKEITRKRGEVQIIYRVNAANNPLRSYLNDKATVFAVQIQSLTPLEREYSALMALEYYDLSEEVIRAKPSPLLEYKDFELSEIRKTYNVNNAQAKAVKSAVDNDAFTLIQGPPGSGKTKTICAIVGAILTGAIKPGNRSQASNARPASTPPSRKMLVCAPSNAAVDELVMRLKAGVKLMDGSDEQINVVRLGRSDAINAGVKDVTLEELVNAKLSLIAPKDSKEDIHAVMMEHKATSEEFIKHRTKMEENRARGQASSEEDERIFDGLKRKKTALGAKIDHLREQQNNVSRDADVSRRRMQQEVLDSAHILCATLSGSGHEIFQGLNVEFETVIIDEAAQCIELSALIPLKYGCNKCILVGDPKQLPPTVLSREAAKFQYEQSLFARMEGNHRKDVHLLDTQYRMHPEISLFPSKMFYDSRLQDGPGMAKLRTRPWHHSAIFAPYRFFDVQGMSQAATKGHSLVNIAELNVAMQLYDRLTTDVTKYDFRGKIGIITPYKGQLNELKSRFRHRYGESILSEIEFNTTDAFQGRESEIIIFSCVRASTKGLGFLNDIRRMNVGLTRAKCSLWVLGNSEALTKGEYWNSLVSNAKSRNLYTDGDIPQLLRRPLLTADMMREDVVMRDADESTALETVLPELSNGRRTTESSGTPTIKREEEVSPNLGRPSDELVRHSSVASLPSQVSSRRESDASHKSSESKAVKREPAGTDRKPVIDIGDRHGASGGRSGLNDKAKCQACGSHDHHTHRCDNKTAHESRLGRCDRCKKAGHTFAMCREARCIACGQMGHLEQTCNAPAARKLSAEERKHVKMQEVDFGRQRDRARERLAGKQLGDHARTIPTVRATNGAPSDLKRKREDGSQTRTEPKTTTVEHDQPARPPAPQSTGPPRLPNHRPRPIPAQIIKKKKTNAEDIFLKRK